MQDLSCPPLAILFLFLAIVGTPLMPSSGIRAQNSEPTLGPTSCDSPGSVEAVGLATYGTLGLPRLDLRGAPLKGLPFHLEVQGLPLAHGALLFSPHEEPHHFPAFGATGFPGLPLFVQPFALNAAGSSPPLLHRFPVTTELCRRSFVAQAIISDPGAMGGLAFTKALRIRFGARTEGPLFGAASSFSVGQMPLSVAVGDLNGDQLADIATGNFDGTVSVLWNQGNGTFVAAPSFPANNQPLDSVAIGDLNGDRLPDLAIASSGGLNGGDVSILLGLGGGAFGPPQFFPAGQGPASVAIEDLDGDGTLDLAVADVFNGGGAFSNGAVSILIGVGDGSFGAPQTYVAGVGVSSVAIGDLNNDLVPDLAVSNRDSIAGAASSPPTVSVLLGVGDGTFGAAQNFPVSSDPNADALTVVIANLNPDQLPDLAIATPSGLSGGSVSVLPGQGGGTFGVPVSYGVGSRPVSVVAGDFNGDQMYDLAVANVTSNDVSLLLGREDGGFAQPLSLPAGAGPRSIATGDVNEDGVCDLVVADVKGDEVSVFLNQLLSEVDTSEHAIPALGLRPARALRAP